MLSLSKTITVSSLNKLNVLEQQLRMFRTRKPPWVPRSKTTQFRVPAVIDVDLEEKLYMENIIRNWRSEMKSIYQLLKTEAKFSDKASLVAQEEKRKSLEQEKLLLAENNKRNANILEAQLIDIDENIAAQKIHIENELRLKNEKEQMFIQVADGKIRQLKEKAKNFIDPENLEFEIEKMLNERHDYNFGINQSGDFFKVSKIVSKAEVFDTKFVESDTI